MEKIIDKQFFLIVNGPSCAGKSAVADYLCENYGSIFKANGDRIKWLISDYNRSVHKEVANDMLDSVIKVALYNGLSALKEGTFEPERYIKIADEFDVPLMVANISAPSEVLMERFQERIEAKQNGAKISNTDPERLKELHQMYLNTKMETSLEFDSSRQSPEEISQAIVEYIRNNT